ncbi:winged helix DNA-binding protein [Streptomyces sp. NPDC051243]|uniref:transcriptional regulator, SarA/Rot family n=1 Tax=Streptomyces sp. NPDC051243 TaxID=3365646 RepID=UPI0037A1D44D
MLNTLERKGLIQRSRSDKDGRSVTIQLTDYGHDVVGELFRTQQRPRGRVGSSPDRPRARHPDPAAAEDPSA